jgi:DNA-binding XRE family transcriptional regulator
MEVTHPLKEWRSREGLNQETAAQQLGLKAPTLCRLEKGNRQPSPKLAKKLSEQTGIPVSKLRPDLAELLRGAA